MNNKTFFDFSLRKHKCKKKQGLIDQNKVTAFPTAIFLTRKLKIRIQFRTLFLKETKLEKLNTL